MATDRKQAPKLCDGEYPDWFWLLSGGLDSVAAFLLTVDAIRENYGKRAVAIYLDTRIGNPAQRLYVEQLVDAYGEEVWALRTHEKFEDRVAKRGKFEGRDDAGPPGGSQHSNVQNELKGRQRGILERGYDQIHYITGIRKQESPQRAEYPKGEHDDDIVYVKPVYELTKKQCAEIIIRHEDCPVNPTWLYPDVIADCGCLSNGDPSELDKTEELFPEFARRMREIEEASAFDGVEGILGWDGLTADERDRRKHGHQQMTLCGESCGRQRDPRVVRALRMKAAGRTVNSCLSTLYGGHVPQSERVPMC